MKRRILASLLCVCVIGGLVGCGQVKLEPSEKSGEGLIDGENIYEEEHGMSEVNEDVLNTDKVITDGVLTSNTSMLQKSSMIVDESYNNANIMYSPLSLNLALGLVSNGMSDDGQAFISKYFGMDLYSYNAFVKAYLNELPDTIEIANGLFVDSKYTLKSDVQSLLQESYQAGIESLDFNDILTPVFINNWCSEKTHGMIPSIVDDVSPYSLVATNALYFKDTWLESVSDSYVDVNGIFKMFDGSEQICNMMNTTESIYLENNKATGFVKKYANTDYGFVAMLPKSEGDFSVSDLDIESLLESQSANNTVVASFPEFTFESVLSLKDVLSNLGLGYIFEDGLCENLLAEDVAKIDAILQKTKVDVNREGTEAAAVTSIMVATNSLNIQERYVVTLDRPFAFMIYDFEHDMPLFIGKVVSMK